MRTSNEMQKPLHGWCSGPRYRTERFACRSPMLITSQNTQRLLVESWGILMVAAKKPLVVGQLQQNFIQKAVQLVGLAAGKGGKIKNLLGASWVST